LSGPETRLVLAGFVAADANRVAAAYAGYGCRRLRRIDQDGWTTLVLIHRR
jgi:ribosomal protein L11 methylase PrmA